MVDIIVTNYNNGELLTRCLKSVLTQTIGLDKLRCIIIDDASTDGSLGMAEKAIPEDAPFYIYVNPVNVGAGLSRRKGIEYAKSFGDSEYTLFLDGDDTITDNYIRDLYNTALLTGADIAIGLIKREGPNGWEGYTDTRGKLGKVTICDAKEYILGRMGELLLFLNNNLVKTSLWDNVEYSASRFIEDTPTTYRLYYYADKIAFSDAGYYNYMNNPKSLTSTGRNDGMKYTLYTLLSGIETYEFCKDKPDYPVVTIDAIKAGLFSFKLNNINIKDMYRRYPEETSRLVEFIQKYKLGGCMSRLELKC